MTLERYRFAGGAPDEAALLSRLSQCFGGTVPYGFERFEVKGERVHVTSMDWIALVYAARICVELGGVRLAFTKDEPVAAPPSPPWSARPWASYGWLTRLRIRLGWFRG
jgi:hypothetical protein